MGPAAPAQRDLVLVGGGHAHAIALRMLAMRPLAGLRITLVSPDSHSPYSGMLPGLIAGHYAFEQTHIDLERLCQWAGARFLRAEACGLRPARGELELVGRPSLAYDLLSLDIGSRPELASVPGAAEHTIPVKPVSDLWQRWQTFLDSLRETPDKPRRVAVVGGGAGSVELVLAMAHRLRDAPVRFTLCTAGNEILQGYNRRARKACLQALDRAGVRLARAARVQRVSRGCLHTCAGDLSGFAEIFWCTGAAPAPWLANSGLATDEQGFLLLRDTLQAESDPCVFGAGDTATQRAHPRPKAGVYAVRQGPVLAHNLRQCLLDRGLRRHRPQRRFLSLLSLGGRRATADRGPFSATGAWVWYWKDHIDRKFMRRFLELPATMPRAVRGRLPALSATSPQAPCGGCGAKVGADELAAALSALRERYPDTCPAAACADDTARVEIERGQVLLQSVDVLREMLRDPWRMGQLAANHALSDLHASGARPLSALAVITLPFASERLQRRDLEQVLDGALSIFSREHCVLAGGHTLQGMELAVGFVVNGVPLDPGGATLGKHGLQVGDRLLLTKALGTGVLYAAAMQGLADGRDLETAQASMLRSNLPAARIALAHGASAATDVTGFGLLGHLREMLPEDMGVRLELGALPALPGARQLLAEGVRSTAHEANWRAAQSLFSPAVEGDEVDRALACDPQTCGGLLLGIAPGREAALVQALDRAGTETSVIGVVSSRG